MQLNIFEDLSRDEAMDNRHNVPPQTLISNASSHRTQAGYVDICYKIRWAYLILIYASACSHY